MSDKRVMTVKLLLLAVLALPTLAPAQSGGGLSARPGTGAVRGLPASPRPGSRSTVIGDGMGGFTTYGSGGVTRHIIGPTTPGAVYDPQGNRYQVIQDGQGNLDVQGPAGAQKVFRTSPPGNAAEPGAGTTE